jgi:hypothetical protein
MSVLFIKESRQLYIFAPLCLKTGFTAYQEIKEIESNKKENAYNSTIS